jgi:hypothetical protein
MVINLSAILRRLQIWRLYQLYFTPVSRGGELFIFSGDRWGYFKAIVSEKPSQQKYDYYIEAQTIIINPVHPFTPYFVIYILT